MFQEFLRYKIGTNTIKYWLGYNGIIALYWIALYLFGFLMPRAGHKPDGLTDFYDFMALILLWQVIIVVVFFVIFLLNKRKQLKV